MTSSACASPELLKSAAGPPAVGVDTAGAGANGLKSEGDLHAARRAGKLKGGLRMSCAATPHRARAARPVSFRLLAFHYPKPEHRTEMLHRLARAVEVMASADGCLEAEYWQEAASQALVATAKFDSKQHWLDALDRTAVMVDIAYDEREARPREVYQLVDP